ncbi:EAL domain-containing protein [Sphingomonas sp. 1185]|uniref:putative bifunctional diguanylate cyclase/phosphodiesterase n=1 Tax=Sphingomonas sp. 1185 TaxID=3156411 RepID=UPI00339AADFA
MTWLHRRIQSLEFRFAAMLTIVLGIFMLLGGCGLLLNNQLLTMVQSTRRIATLLDQHDKKDAQLRDFRIRVGALTRRVEQGGSVPAQRWHMLDASARAWLAASRVEDGGVPPDLVTAYDEELAAERQLLRTARDVIRRVSDRDSMKRTMPVFIAELHVLEGRRDAVHERLIRRLGWQTREVEALARRALVQMVLAGLLVVILVSGLILWLRNRIMRPLMNIVAAMRAMSAGLTLEPLCLGRRDELGELARGMDALARAAEERERIQRQVEYLAHHDPLTGLANRVVFERRLNAALQAGRRIALLAIDLDGFKGVNDTLGHATGDTMLRRASDLLAAAVGSGDTVARIGGDEFAIIHHLAPDEQDAEALVRRIYAIVANDPASPAVRMSIGVALSPRHGREADELQACADIALYRAKADGRHRARHYDAAMDEERRQRRWLAHELRDAGVRGELQLAFQPIADCRTRRIIGQEALARWTHPVLGPVSPDVFIAIAEEDGMIGEIGHRLLIEALIVARAWPREWMLAINLSPVQLRDPMLAMQMLATILDHGFDPRRVEVEVTEGVLIEQRETATANLCALRQAGVRIVMDDFGTGYSSLSSLQQFRFDKIKIDRSFTSGMDSHGPALSIVRASIGLGRSLNIPIVAEGVETEAQLATLRELGCDQIQGYLIGRPGVVQARAA